MINNTSFSEKLIVEKFNGPRNQRQRKVECYAREWLSVDALYLCVECHIYQIFSHITIAQFKLSTKFQNVPKIFQSDTVVTV